MSPIKRFDCWFSLREIGLGFGITPRRPNGALFITLICFNIQVNWGYQ